MDHNDCIQHLYLYSDTHISQYIECMNSYGHYCDVVGINEINKLYITTVLLISSQFSVFRFSFIVNIIII